MKRAHAILLIGGSLVAAGMIMSYLGSKLATEDLAVVEGLPSDGLPIELTKDLDPATSGVGAFVVHADSFEDGKLRAVLFDPGGAQITSKAIDRVSTEEQFEIRQDGTYRLVLENSGAQTPAIIGLTHMPEKSILALNLLGQGTIVSGFVGLAVALVYLVVGRKRSV